MLPWCFFEVAIRIPGERHLQCGHESSCHRGGSVFRAAGPTVASSEKELHIRHSKRDPSVHPAELLGIFWGRCFFWTFPTADDVRWSHVIESPRSKEVFATGHEHCAEEEQVGLKMQGMVGGVGGAASGSDRKRCEKRRWKVQKAATIAWPSRLNRASRALR